MTDPLPFLRSISHSCTVPSEAVTLKRKLPFTFFTKLGPSWLREGERESVRKEGGKGREGGRGGREEGEKGERRQMKK